MRVACACAAGVLRKPVHIYILSVLRVIYLIESIVYTGDRAGDREWSERLVSVRSCRTVSLAVTDGLMADGTTTPKADGSRVRTALNADLICDAVSGGTTIAQICRDLDISRMSIYEWINADSAFAERMEQARAAGYDAIADEAFRIADDGTYDTIEGKYGPKLDTEWVARSKLRVETRLKLLAKWHPKRYGEKIELETRNVTATTAISDDPIEAARQYEQIMRGR